MVWCCSPSPREDLRGVAHRPLFKKDKSRGWLSPLRADPAHVPGLLEAGPPTSCPQQEVTGAASRLHAGTLLQPRVAILLHVGQGHPAARDHLLLHVLPPVHAPHPHAAGVHPTTSPPLAAEDAVTLAHVHQGGGDHPDALLQALPLVRQGVCFIETLCSFFSLTLALYEYICSLIKLFPLLSFDLC